MLDYKPTTTSAYVDYNNYLNYNMLDYKHHMRYVESIIMKIIEDQIPDYKHHMRYVEYLY